MGYFSERTRVKVDDQGLVRVSVRADQTSVDEYVFAYAEFEVVREAYENSMDVRSSNIRVKRISKGYSIQIKDGAFRRKIYDFAISEYQLLMAQYASASILFEKSGGMSQIGVLEPVDDIKTLSLKLEHSFERLYEEVQKAGSKKGVDFDLKGVLNSIDQKLNSILEATQNIKITTVQGGQNVTENTREIEDDFFIPSSFEGESFKGKVTKSSTTSADSTDSAAEALRKLRQSKKS